MEERSSGAVSLGETGDLGCDKRNRAEIGREAGVGGVIVAACTLHSDLPAN